MGITSFPNGVSSFGVPVLPLTGSTVNTPSTGQVFFVNNGTVVNLPGYATGVNDASSFGTTPQRPFSTLQYAINQCKNNNGDVIYVLGAHSETISAAGGITCSASGITICGVPFGNFMNKPTFTFSTSTAATFLISAANVTIRNLKLDAVTSNTVNLVTMVDVEAASPWFDACEFYQGTSSSVTAQYAVNFGTAVYANFARFTNNYIHGDSGMAAATASPITGIQFAGGNKVFCQGNVIVAPHTYNIGGINNVTADMTDFVLDSNIIVNEYASSNAAVTLFSQSTAEITNNRFGTKGVTSASTVVANGGLGYVYFAGNYYCATAQSSVLL